MSALDHSVDLYLARHTMIMIKIADEAPFKTMMQVCQVQTLQTQLGSQKPIFDFTLQPLQN